MNLEYWFCDGCLFFDVVCHVEAMAAQLKEIVDRLNAEPFNLDLSLVGFDEKDGEMQIGCRICVDL